MKLSRSRNSTNKPSQIYKFLFYLEKFRVNHEDVDAFLCFILFSLILIGNLENQNFQKQKSRSPTSKAMKRT
jgi:hypothetical protein